MVLLALILGLLVGSFANVVIYRLPLECSIVTPRSYCPKCGKTLAPIDLLPVLSYLWLRGKCRYCRAPIPLRYPLVELLMSAGFAGLAFLYPSPLSFAKAAAVYFIFVVLVAIDLVYMRLPNALTLPALIFGLATAEIAPGPGFVSGLAGGATGALVVMALAALSRGGMGMGDAKLLAFIGTLTGPAGALLALFLGSLIGALVTLPLTLAGRLRLKDRIPFGPFLVSGGLVVMLFGSRLLAFWLG